jgi:hypothetical protein
MGWTEEQIRRRRRAIENAIALIGSLAKSLVCEKREDTVNERQATFDRAKAEVKAGDLIIEPATHVKAAVMVALCLAAALIIGLGNVRYSQGNTKKIARITAEGQRSPRFVSP